MQAQKLTQQKKTKIQTLRQDMTNSFVAFSKGLKETDFDAAMKTRQELLDMNESATSLDKIKINSVEIYKKSFEFPEVAKNDFSSEVLDELEIAEKNLNSNLDNVDLFNDFVDIAEKSKTRLKSKYADQWNDPANGSAPKDSSEDDD